MPLSIEFKGMEKIISRLSPGLLNDHLRKFLIRSSTIVQNKARDNANERAHDSGQLLTSIIPEIDSSAPPLWAKVGHLGAGEGSTLWWKAVAMEYGTGLLAEGPNASGKRHWPPPSALDVWAKRHGFPSGAVVARMIGFRGGLTPRRYLRDALQKSLAATENEIARVSNEIKASFES